MKAKNGVLLTRTQFLNTSLKDNSRSSRQDASHLVALLKANVSVSESEANIDSKLLTWHQLVLTGFADLSCKGPLHQTPIAANSGNNMKQSEHR